MDGMGMLLKSMGVDPEKLKGQFTEVVAHLNAEVTGINETQFRIEKKLDEVLARQGIHEPEFDPTQESGQFDSPMQV